MFCFALDMSSKETNHLSLNNHFAHLLKLLMSTENKLKRQQEHIKKVRSLFRILED